MINGVFIIFLIFCTTTQTWYCCDWWILIIQRFLSTNDKRSTPADVHGNRYQNDTYNDVEMSTEDKMQNDQFWHGLNNKLKNENITWQQMNIVAWPKVCFHFFLFSSGIISHWNMLEQHKAAHPWYTFSQNSNGILAKLYSHDVLLVR